MWLEGHDGALRQEIETHAYHAYLSAVNGHGREVIILCYRESREVSVPQAGFN